METVIVTGGAGFIGSHAVDALAARGHEVHVIDDLSSGKRSNVHRHAKLHVADIRTKKIGALVKKIAPSSVVHLAAHIDVRKSVNAPSADAAINIMGGLNVLEAAIQAGARHFVFASSAAVYGPVKELPAGEDAPKAPSSPYGVAKFAFEHYLHVAHHLHGLHCAILRFANVYGPRQTAKGEAGAVSIFLKHLFAGEQPTINGDGGQTRDFIYVGDVARAVAASMEQNVHGTFNVSTGRETSVNELYAKLKKLSGSRLTALRGPSKPNEDRRSCLDPRKAEAALGWRAEVSLDEGLARTVESARGTRTL